MGSTWAVYKDSVHARASATLRCRGSVMQRRVVMQPEVLTRPIHNVVVNVVHIACAMASVILVALLRLRNYTPLNC